MKKRVLSNGAVVKTFDKVSAQRATFHPVKFKLELMPAIMEGRLSGSVALEFLDELLADAISVSYPIDTSSSGVRAVLQMLVEDEDVPSFDQKRFNALCGISK